MIEEAKRLVWSWAHAQIGDKTWVLSNPDCQACSEWLNHLGLFADKPGFTTANAVRLALTKPTKFDKWVTLKRIT